MRVRPMTDVRVRVDSGRFGDGTFYLAPELGRCSEAAASLRVRGVAPRPNSDGSYAISSRRETAGGRQIERLVLSVDNGAAYIQWARGPLSVVALGREVRITGTELVVLADSATRRALLYVREGTVAFLGAGGLTAAAGRALVFGSEGAPTTIGVDETLANEALYHSRVIWTQPLRGVAPPARGYGRLLGVLGGTALAAGGITYLVLRNRDAHSSGGTRQGTIIIRLPL
jgi:hypothetical protein